MRIAAVALVIVLGLACAGTVVAQPAPGPRGSCEALSDFLSVTATVFTPVPILEFQLLLQSKSPRKLRVEPAMFALASPQIARVSPLTFEEARAVVQNPAQAVAGLLIGGLFGYFANVESQKRWTAHVETNMFKATELAPEGNTKGSLFFRPNLSLTQVTLSMEGLSDDAGAQLPTLTTVCPVPTLGGQVSAGPATRTYVMTAQAASGPVILSVQRVEFSKDQTVLSVTIENTAAEEINLFVPIADTKLTDDAGKTYFVRTLRSNVPDRVGARARVQGQLVFEALPPAIKKATLNMPGIRIGDAVHEVNVELRF